MNSCTQTPPPSLMVPLNWYKYIYIYILGFVCKAEEASAKHSKSPAELCEILQDVPALNSDVFRCQFLLRVSAVLEILTCTAIPHGAGVKSAEPFL